MSYLHCNRCGDLINTDDDPGAYVAHTDDGSEIYVADPEKHPRFIYSEWICERCREDGELEEEDE